MGAIERRIAQKAKAMTREQVIVKAIEKRITWLELSHVIARKPYPSIDRLSDMQHAMSMSKPALREVAIEHSIDDRFVRKLDKDRFIEHTYASYGVI